MKTPVSDYLFSPLVWIQITILFLLLTLLALVLTPLGPLLGAWAGNTFVKELTIQGVSGSLLNRVDIEKIEWRDGDVTTLKDISIEPGRPDFSINQWPIEALTIQSLEVELSLDSEPRKRGELVDIGDFGTSPVNFLIKSGKLLQFKVLEAGTALFQMNDAVLDGTLVKDNQLYLTDVSAEMVVESEIVSLSIPNATMNMMVPHEIDIEGVLGWKHPDVGDVSTKLHIGGLLQSYKISANGGIVHPELGTQSFVLKGEGDFDHIDVERLTLGGNSGSLLSDGEVVWVPDLLVDLDLTASNLKTAQFVPEWPADITGKLALKVAQQGDKLRGGLDIKSLNGTLRGYPLTGSGKVSMLNNELQFDQLELRSTDNVLKVNGRGSEPFDLKWDINGRDLSKMMPGVTGRVSARGTLSGNRQEPVIDGDLNTTRLSFQGNKLDSGDLTIKTVEGEFQLDGRFQGVLINGERVRSATLSGTGNVDQHSVILSASHTQAKFSAAVDGQWDGKQWVGKLKKVVVNDQTFGRWSLQKPTAILASSKGIVADELCMVASDGSACTNVNYTQQGGFSTTGKLVQAPLQMLNPLLPETVKLDGRVGGDYTVSLEPDLKGNAELSFAPGQVILNQDGTRQRIAYRKGTIKAEIDGKNIKADTRFQLIDDGLINIQADVQLSPDDGKHQIDAEGEFKSIPLTLGQAFLPPEMHLSGSASGSFSAKQDKDSRKGKLLFNSQNVQFSYTDESVGQQQYTFSQADVDATLQDDQLQAKAQLSLLSGGRLEARANVDLSQPDLTKAVIADGSINTMPLALLRPYLPAGFDIDGVMSGDFDVKQEDGGPSGRLDLVANNGFFVYEPDGGSAQRYLYNTAAIQGSMRGDKVDGNVEFDLKNGGRFSGRAEVDLSNPDIIKAVNAEGKVEAVPLAMLSPYLPPAFEVDGLISGDYSVSQQAGQPAGRFNLASNEGRFSYKAEGTAKALYQYRGAQIQGTLQGDVLLADVGLELKDGGLLTSKIKTEVSSLNTTPVFSTEGTIKDMPMALAQAYLPDSLSVKGRINAEYQLEQKDKLKGMVRLDLPASSFSYNDGSSGSQTYRYKSAEIVANIDGDFVETDIAFALLDGGSFSTNGSLDLSQPNNLFAFEGSGRFEAFPLALVQPYLPIPMTFKGVAEGSYQLSQKNGQQGQIELSLPASHFTVMDSEGRPQTYEYKTGRLNATIKGKSITADAQIALTDGGVIDSKATVVLGANSASHRIKIEGTLVAVPLALLEPYSPEDLSFPGKVNGSYTLSQRNAKLSGKLNLTLPNSYFVVETASGDKQPFAYEQGVLSTTIDGDRINIDSTLVFKGKGDLRARAQIVLRDKGDPSINGVAEINVPNIYWAQAYVPYSRGLRGQVVGKVSFSGLVSQPKVTGQLAMSNGYLRLPQVGTEFSDINLRIQANRANQAIIVGSMKSGGGVIQANGQLSLADVKNWTAQMSLKGSNIKFVDTHEAKAYMTPNLQINANPKAVVIRGTVDIPKADINLKDLPEFSIDESEDVIVLGEKVPGSTINTVRMQPNIVVRLGNEVRFKGFGFKTRLVGALRVTNSRNTIVTNGSLNILEGRYEAYGQDLKIDNGRLVFNGPPKNVGVDVRAVREVDSGEVGIHLTGTIQKLKSTIFSDPVMQETDALSYLVTGHSLASATGRETALLMQAVRGLGIDGSEGLIQRIGKSLGLDDLSIVTRDDFRESELQLGKKLGSKLYVRYLVGLFDSAHRVAVDYKINKYLNLEIQAGEEQSLDLIYEYEKD